MTNTPALHVKPVLFISGIILLFMGVLTGWAWFQIPADQQIPVHWGADGLPDQYGGRFEGLMLTPLIAAGLVVLMAVIPRIEPRKFNLERSRRVYVILWIVMTVFCFGIHLVMVLSALGRDVDVSVIVPVGVGVLFLIIGNYLGKVRSNFFVGIKTPWTLSSDLSWNKTHRLGGWLFVLLGLLMISAGLIGHPMFLKTLIPIGVVGVVLVTFVYSYLVWKKDPQKQTIGR